MLPGIPDPLSTVCGIVSGGEGNLDSEASHVRGTTCWLNTENVELMEKILFCEEEVFSFPPLTLDGLLHGEASER